ncbi:MAG: hypothetical protein ACMUIM_00180 [bacterium]
MPSSWIENVPMIVKCILAVNPKRMLDLGLGSGKYGFLIRELTDFMSNRLDPHTWEMIIEGVEVYGEYIQDHQRYIYNHVFISEALDFLTKYKGPKYDVAIAIDIIEHFEPWDVVEFVKYALQVSRYLIISTPTDFFEQDICENELENHKSWWPKKALRRLAKICNAEIRILRVYKSSVAILSHENKLPKIKRRRARAFLRFFAGLFFPELLYYKIKGRTGRNILNTPPPQTSQIS